MAEECTYEEASRRLILKLVDLGRDRFGGDVAFSEECGFPPAYMGKLRNGTTKKPSLPNLLRMLDTLGLTMQLTRRKAP